MTTFSPASPSAARQAQPQRLVRRLPARLQRGVALLEALLAVLILAIGLLGTIGLQARAYSALSDAGMRAEATMAADRLFGIMSNDVANLNSYALALSGTPSTQLSAWYAQTRANMTGNTTTIIVTVTPSADLSRTAVVVTISWSRRGGATNKHVVTSYIAAAA